MSSSIRKSPSITAASSGGWILADRFIGKERDHRVLVGIVAGELDAEIFERQLDARTASEIRTRVRQVAAILHQILHCVMGAARVVLPANLGNSGRLAFHFEFVF